MRHNASIRNHKLLLELSRQGIALDGGALAQAKNRLRIRQTVAANEVFDLDDGGAGYIISVLIENLASEPIRVNELRLEVPWQEPFLQWLRLPRKSGMGYSFPPEGVRKNSMRVWY